jgi:hypothetical protein
MGLATSAYFRLMKYRNIQFSINSNNKGNQIENTLPIAEIISLNNTIIGAVII